MARASYIYTVWSRGQVLAGFTVKHEAVTWAEKQTDREMSDMFLWRGPDGAAWCLNMQPVKWPTDVTSGDDIPREQWLDT